MKPVKLIALFVLMLSASLLITLPASTVLSQIKLNKELQLGAVEGPWWSFNADWLSYQGITQEKTAFQFKPMCLLTAAICFDVSNAHADLKLKVSLITNSLSLSDSHFSMNFSQMTPMLSSLLVKPTGSVKVNVTSLQWQDNALIDLSATVNWLDVGVQGEDFNLGGIQANLTHQSQLITINLSDQSDTLDLSGIVKVSKAGVINSDVQLTTLSRFPTSLKSILQSVMVKRGKDIFEYKAKLNNRVIKNSNIRF